MNSIRPSAFYHEILISYCVSLFYFVVLNIKSICKLQLKNIDVYIYIYNFLNICYECIHDSYVIKFLGIYFLTVIMFCKILFRVHLSRLLAKFSVQRSFIYLYKRKIAFGFFVLRFFQGSFDSTNSN